MFFGVLCRAPAWRLLPRALVFAVRETASEASVTLFHGPLASFVYLYQMRPKYYNNTNVSAGWNLEMRPPNLPRRTQCFSLKLVPSKCWWCALYPDPINGTDATSSSL
jgi:hypothetical protein